MLHSHHKASVVGGTMIVAGTTIGAGMLALPTISAGMWFFWSLLLLCLCWQLMLLSSRAILEVNLQYSPGASFHTMVRDTLGDTWNLINGISVAFVLYILLYAYISGGASIVRHTLDATLHVMPSKLTAGLFFVTGLTFCVWISTWIVDRLSVLMMGGMVVTFLLSMSGVLSQIRVNVLLDVGGEGGSAIFVMGALSTYLTSFCFHASVPSLVKYFGRQPKAIDRCLLLGTSIAFVCYLAWVTACDGVISREGYKAVIAAGGNVGDLVRAAGANLDSGFILRMLEAFSSLAVATSFLGAGLGLFDYMADLCKFDDTRLGRTKTTLITFLPPTLCWIFWPDGFLLAIGWAGLAATIWSVIVPALMLRASRRKFSAADYRAPGGELAVQLLLVFGSVTALCHVLFVLDVLPMYK